ncbi:hypothetical protein K2Z83_05140 [Oscillochloris sp. ZM17-4]|uniref:hypothetical protein n=1 Tax=Oscillochloris sp. ZM17-4 TaxID=2866714 RepID=UPI001C7314FC|nr:hypothetical protein [Oscillochloris sp. ZM17-4]MBX0327068.1 hypothetical protein [Oscillochloris sp. ZM17-4]
MSSPQPTVDDAQESMAVCTRALRVLFEPGEPVWITEAAYEENGPTWRVTLLCPGERGGWSRRRYHYDIPSGTLHFAGATPAGEGDLAAARQSGRRI